MPLVPDASHLENRSFGSRRSERFGPKPYHRQTRAGSHLGSRLDAVQLLGLRISFIKIWKLRIPRVETVCCV